MLLIGMTMVASAAMVSVTTLAHPGSLLQSRLEFSTAGGVVSHGTWGRTPAATERAAIGNLFDLLLCGMGAVVAVAVVSLVSLFGARESQRTGELVARRAVGASRRLLVGSALIEACILASSALVAGSGAGALATRRSLMSWPGHYGYASILPSIVGLSALGGLFVLCAVLPWLFARNRSATATGSPVPLALPAFQLGLSLIVLTAAGLLTRQAALRLESKPAASAAGQVFRQLADDSTPADRANRYGMLLDELDARAGGSIR